MPEKFVVTFQEVITYETVVEAPDVSDAVLVAKVYFDQGEFTREVDAETGTFAVKHATAGDEREPVNSTKPQT
jgi:hypothetical protein